MADRHDVGLVELAALDDPSVLAAAVADSLGVMVGPDATVVDSLIAALDGRSILVVLDNCEHLVDAAAALAEAILGGCHGVRILATSRQPLGVAGEQQLPVEPLDTSSGIQLFTDRARAVRPSFVVDGTAVQEICDRLDGLPLAIELAAARVLTLSADDIAARLTDRFRLLVGGRRGPQRHRTLGGAIGWSFDLLDPVERATLCACAVFFGGFDLVAATAIADAGDEYDVLDVLESLTRQSLLVARPGASGTRFTMLETIRQFAAQQPEAIAAHDMLRDRHARHFAGVAHADVVGRSRARQPARRVRVEPAARRHRRGRRHRRRRDRVGVALLPVRADRLDRRGARPGHSNAIRSSWPACTWRRASAHGSASQIEP